MSWNAAEAKEAVSVAIRVRDLNEREIDCGATRIVRVNNRNETFADVLVSNPETEGEREFTFRHCFNSQNEDSEKNDSPAATQETVYDDLVRPLVDAAVEGRNLCVLAYGEAGAGKTNSMLGHSKTLVNEGIVRRACRHIFRSVEADRNADQLANITVSIQVAEIYREKVHDLLSVYKGWPPEGHVLKSTPDAGCTLNTTAYECFSFADVKSALSFATKNRALQQLAFNTDLSLTDTLYVVSYSREWRTPEDPSQCLKVSSRLLFADLRSSSRKETIESIATFTPNPNRGLNHSSVALRHTINTMVEGRRKADFAESKLTLLLQPFLTGGKIALLAAISPASTHFEETLNTLFFAKRMAKLKTSVNKNVTRVEDPMVGFWKQFVQGDAELRRVKVELMSPHGSPRSGARGNATEWLSPHGSPRSGARGNATVWPGVVPPPAIASPTSPRWGRAGLVGSPSSPRSPGSAGSPTFHDLRRMEKRDGENERALKEALAARTPKKSTNEQRHAHNAKVQANWMNALGDTIVDGPPESLKGPHLISLHPDPHVAEALVYDISEPLVRVGRAVRRGDSSEIELNGIGIATDHCMFAHEDSGEVWLVSGEGAICRVNGVHVSGKKQVRHNDRIWVGNDYVFRLALPGKETEGGVLEDGKRADYQMAITEINSSSSASSAFKDAVKQVAQANAISRDLIGDNQKFAVKLAKRRRALLKDQIAGEGDSVDQIIFELNTPRGPLRWSREKFEDRLPSMIDLWQSWRQTTDAGKAFTMPTDDDANPFVDNDYHLIGEADCWMQNLMNMIELSVDPTILSPWGSIVGKMYVDILPLDENGNEGPWDEDDDLDPFIDDWDYDELKGKTLRFVVKVPKLFLFIEGKKGCQPQFYDTFVRYKINVMDTTEYIESEHELVNTTEVHLGHEKQIEFVVDEWWSRFVTKGKITFEVWGKRKSEAGSSNGLEDVMYVPKGWTFGAVLQDSDGCLFMEPPKASRDSTDAAKDETDEETTESEPVLIGEGVADFSDSMKHMFECTVPFLVTSTDGEQVGKMAAEFKPLDKDGNEGTWEEDDDLDPFITEWDYDAMKGSTIRFAVVVSKFEFNTGKRGNLPPEYCKTFIRYKIGTGGDDASCECIGSDTVETYTVRPEYNHRHKFDLVVDEDVSKFITTGKIKFEVWGTHLKEKYRDLSGWRVVDAFQDPNGRLYDKAPWHL